MRIPPNNQSILSVLAANLLFWRCCFIKIFIYRLASNPSSTHTTPVIHLQYITIYCIYAKSSICSNFCVKKGGICQISSLLLFKYLQLFIFIQSKSITSGITLEYSHHFFLSQCQRSGTCSWFWVALKTSPFFIIPRNTEQSILGCAQTRQLDSAGVIL